MFCPRCGKEDITVLDESLSIYEKQITLKRKRCGGCHSQWYFYEEILEYGALMMRKPSSKIKEATK